MSSEKPSINSRVAFYGRVSQPRQKLEHQIELGERWCLETGVNINTNSWYLDRGGRRHKSEKRAAFQRLLDAIKERKFDWVVVALFDRWGVGHINEFFRFRDLLTENGVRLYSIQDDLELTSAQEGHCWQIFSKAMASLATMQGHAEKNIVKMVERALNGWHLSGSHPYGTDLMCCRLSDSQPLFRVHLIEKDVKRRGHGRWLVQHLDSDGAVIREEEANKMPPRDCKTTGYRLTPSLDSKRLEAVRLIHEYYDLGMTNGQIEKALLGRELLYYDKGWGFNCIESILGNSVYIGRPAWAKTATGFYRQAFAGRSAEPRNRNADQPAHYIKDEADFVYPRQLVFPEDAFMDVALFHRVRAKRSARQGAPVRVKSRDTSKHPLSGLLQCPDCLSPMDIHGTQSKGKAKAIKYFICSTYVRSRRRKCKANSVKWSYLDQAADSLMKHFAGQLDQVSVLASGLNGRDQVDDLLKEQMSNADEILHLFLEMVVDVDVESIDCELDLLKCSIDEIRNNQQAVADAFFPVFDRYFRKHELSNSERLKRITELESELDRLAEVAVETPSKRQRESIWARSADTQRMIDRLKQSQLSLADRMAALFTQSDALQRLITDTDTVRNSQIWHALIESIVPIWNEHRAPNEPRVAGFKFTPKKQLGEAVPPAMDIFLAPRGTDSSPPPTSTERGTSHWPSLVRWSRNGPPVADASLPACGD